MQLVVLSKPWPQSTYPSLFNVYIDDAPATNSHKFIYADDICLGTQGGNMQYH